MTLGGSDNVGVGAGWMFSFCSGGLQSSEVGSAGGSSTLGSSAGASWGSGGKMMFGSDGC